MRLPRALTLVFGLAAAASPAFAAEWKIVSEESRLGFVGTQTGTAFEGEFERFSADIAFDPNDLASSKVVAVIDMASAKAGSKDRNEALPGPDWFAVKSFPEARFETSEIRKAEAGDGFVADGTLTIRDKTNPVTLPFTLTIEGDSAKMTGEATLDRSAFGVGQGQWASDQWIAHEVKVVIDLAATRAAP